MKGIIRDTALGQCIRVVSRNTWLRYPEEEPDFQLPAQLQRPRSSSASLTTLVDSPPSASRPTERGSNEETVKPNPSDRTKEKAANANEAEKAAPVQPAKKPVPDGVILVDWYDAHDPDNPHNWAPMFKYFVCFVICALTFAVYLAAAIISPAIPSIMADLHVGEVAATLTLALYVLGYGIGPLLWSPLSEIPRLGRNLFYVAPMICYVAFQAGAATVNTFGGLVTLRFITGFLGSPPLATGAASMIDIFADAKIPYAFAAWTYAAVAGPSFGPVLSAFAVQAYDWRWSMWIQLWLSGLVTVIIFCFLPETSGPNILLRRAQRLRKLTGNPNYKSQGELDSAHLNAKEVAIEALVRPTVIALKDPAVAYVHVYLSVLYATYYLFFEAVPIVFAEIHGFSTPIESLVYIAIAVGIGSSLVVYLVLYRFVVEPKRKAGNPGTPEDILIFGLIWTWIVPAGLWIFAWTSSAEITWVAPVIGLGVFSFGVVIVFQTLFAYLSTIYPQYAASVLAENDFLRSSLAVGLLLAGRPMFVAMGVPAGVSMIAGVTMLMSGFLYVLYFFGANLRQRSKFAVS